jgi:hypothetical protein
VTHDHATSSQRTPDARDIVWPGDAPLNEPLTPVPSGDDIGPLAPIDPPPVDPRDDDGSIDGLPGRIERRDEEDAEPGLDLNPFPLGAANA